MSYPIHRPRRLRTNPKIRELIQETVLLPEKFILPLFVEEALKIEEPIQAMPGQFRWPVSEIIRPIEEAKSFGINSFLLFGSPETKDRTGSSSRDPKGLIPRAIEKIKGAFPDSFLITDVCLCGYTDHGHCGIPDSQGYIQNDETLPFLCQMALSHAKAGADMIAPSDMMDGRVGVIRSALDIDGFTRIPIMSYAAKFSSCFYGPFREAAHSAPSFGDRTSYQMSPSNRREALFEMTLDMDEGADILMVKPAMPYLDVIYEARIRFDCPIAAYQVSGEYSMIKAASANGWVDERGAVLESLLAIRRAGADLIMTYFAVNAAKWLKDNP
ncbi:porphobilinogen synthase [bacterium]|nr:porphobilinogen synthase [bacterium]